MPITRRAALKGALATAIGALTGAVSYGVAYERHRLGVTEATMPFLGLSPALDGLRVALLTDVHHSALVSADDVTRAVADGALPVGEDAGLPLTRFPLEGTAAAHDAVEASTVGKVLIDVAAVS